MRAGLARYIILVDLIGGQYICIGTKKRPAVTKKSNIELEDAYVNIDKMISGLNKP